MASVIEKITVALGDTLTGLANKYNTSVDNLLDLNPQIQDPNYIVAGSELKVSGDAPAKTTNTSNRAIINYFGLVSNTTRMMYAGWKWDKEHTDNYKIMWYYHTGDAIWLIGSSSTTEETQCTYTAPDNAKQVKFKVQPISETHTVEDAQVSYWTAGWSNEISYNFSDNPPQIPPIPTVTVDKFNFTAEIQNIPLDICATHIEFQVVRDNQSIYRTGKSEITMNHASFLCFLAAGHKYKVRCRSCKVSNVVGERYSDWSEYSDDYETIPGAPDRINECKTKSKTSIFLSWTDAQNAKTYDIQYTTKREYFDTTSLTTTINGAEYAWYEVTGLEQGQTYFFRVRAVNDKGESHWCEEVSCVLGKDPAAPTTWSSTTTCVTGDPLYLYWVHNSEDGSSQTYAELEMIIDGVKTTKTIKNTEDEDEKDKTSVYTIDTRAYNEGSKIQWRVRTSGVTGVYGDWSVERTVDIYAPPTLEMIVTDITGNSFDALTCFPFRVECYTGPKSQTPVSYSLSIVSNNTYETVDSIGNTKIVNTGELVYSKQFDTSAPLILDISASDVDLEINMSYTLTCVVAMSSGLTADSKCDFSVAWSDEEYYPNAEIGVDMETYSAYIMPFCTVNSGDTVSLAVYRREFDGSFTEIASGIDGEKHTFVTDPHPSLDFARYRIVATANSTGAVSYYDVPGYPVQCKSILIQWDEEWSEFNSSSPDPMEKPAWSGSLLKLPYNIDVMDKHSMDVSLVEYIGRKHPVSYYGTQLGTTSTWNVAIPKSDKDTLYALRRLAIWTGNVYVREPSGSGYWANITVNFSQKHRDLLIPVTLDIVRVEGGM